jgi:hypothetical protein
MGRSLRAMTYPDGSSKNIRNVLRGSRQGYVDMSCQLNKFARVVDLAITVATYELAQELEERGAVEHRCKPECELGY